MRLCVLESHSPACISPCSPYSCFLPPSPSISLFSVSTCLSTYIYARTRSCYTVRPNNTRVRRSISIWLPEMRLTGPCGFVRISRKNMARVRVRIELYSPLSGWYQTRFRRWSTVSPAKWKNAGQDWRMKGLIFRAENSTPCKYLSCHLITTIDLLSRFWTNNKKNLSDSRFLRTF